jgi:CRP-like cAMP-binding protein
MLARTYQSGESPFSPDELEAFAGLAQSKIHPTSRSTIMGQDDRTDFCIVLESGLVKVMSGKTEKTRQFAALRGPGDLVGEAAAIFNEPRTASIIALTDVEALWIPGSRLRDYCDEHPMIYKKFWRVEQARLAEATRKVNESQMSKERRLALLLVYLVTKGHGQRSGEGVVVKSPQSELAEFMNVSRESISAVMRGFKTSNIVRVVRGKTVICDWELLEKVANGEFTTLQ